MWTYCWGLTACISVTQTEIHFCINNVCTRDAVSRRIAIMYSAQFGVTPTLWLPINGCITSAEWMGLTRRLFQWSFLLQWCWYKDRIWKARSWIWSSWLHVYHGNFFLKRQRVFSQIIAMGYMCVAPLGAEQVTNKTNFVQFNYI